MIIKKIETIPVRLEAIPFATSYGDFSDYHNVIVKVYSDGDYVGIGEASPWLPAESGESQATIVHMIDKYLAPALIGANPIEMDRVHFIMVRLIKGNLLAKAAIDMALHDLVGKAMGVSVASLLGGRYRKSFRTAGAIGVKSADEMEEDAKEWNAMGYKAMKVKLPDITQEDPLTVGVEKVRRIREAMDSDVVLIVDVNMGWRTAAQALEAIKAMEEFDIYIEQPIPATDIDGLEFLTNKTSVPIIADEASFTFAGALEVIKRGAARIFNVKTTRPGGLWKARRIIALAEAAGIFVQIDDVAESRIATTASAQLASTVRDDLYFIYSGGPACAWLTKDLVSQGGVQIQQDGTCTLPDEAGLGITIDEDLLRNSTVEKSMLR